MRKPLIIIAALIIAINLSACGNKTVEEKPQQETKEPAKPDVEAANPDNQANAGDKQPETSEKSPEEYEGAFKIPDFTSQNLDGNEVTNQFIADNKLTIVNVWTTT
ncbi:MAG: hypothetical protein PHC44_00155 [Lutispora sp.]|nr:hypothetical protein [Lutispora sp.]MDD4833136.1 hypothetical protein [Lutispora sp.]